MYPCFIVINEPTKYMFLFFCLSFCLLCTLYDSYSIFLYKILVSVSSVDSHSNIKIISILFLCHFVITNIIFHEANIYMETERLSLLSHSEYLKFLATVYRDEHPQISRGDHVT
jgi:hypothetical protein